MKEIILISCLVDKRFDYVVFQGVFADATIPGPAAFHRGRPRKTACWARKNASNKNKVDDIFKRGEKLSLA